MFHPTTFGKYFLTRRIAVGGMAEVYGAKLYGADGFEKDLVIKQILPQYARDPEFIQSFVAEAKIAVSLTHANIVSIYELGRVDGTYFIAMEFVDGQDVFALLDAARRQKDPLEAGNALLIVEEVCRGLDYAHRKAGPDGLPLGLVHRDLNPRNVLVSRDGDVKILDFGIAKTGHKAAAMPKTRAGVVKGTTGYMSPEQATGQAIDHRTDLYQAGLLLHETLTGRALFWRPEDHVTRELMRKHEIHPPSRTMASLPAEVDDLVLTALRIRPSERFQTAAELASAIARVRAIRFPDASHRSLGAWVKRLVERDRAAARALEDEIPETADFSEVVSQAIEQSITGQVETIATRAPSGVFKAPKRPTTGSQPLDAHVITGDLTPAPAVGPSAGLSAPISGGLAADSLDTHEHTLDPIEAFEAPALDIEDAVVETSAAFAEAPPSRPRPAWAWVAAGAVAALAGVALLPMLVTTPEGPKPSRAAPLEPPPPKAAPEAKVTEPPAAPPNLQPPKPAKAKAPALKASHTVVDFGASCQARVFVDGAPLEKRTPIINHKLAPGTYRVVMKGLGCRTAQPSSLEARVPQVSTRLVLKAGQHRRLRGDFVKRRITNTLIVSDRTRTR